MPAIGLFNLHDDGRVRPSQQLRQHHAGLRVAVIVGLQAGEDQIKLLIFNCRRKCPRGVRRVQPHKTGILKMNGTVRALGQRLAKHLLRPRRPGGNGDHFPAMLFFLPQSFFERKRVRLIHFVRNILTNPSPRLIQLERRILLRNLLHAHQNLQGISDSECMRMRSINQAVSIWHLALSDSQRAPRKSARKPRG